jgi:hypothetical protein
LLTIPSKSSPRDAILWYWDSIAEGVRGTRKMSRVEDLQDEALYVCSSYESGASKNS